MIYFLKTAENNIKIGWAKDTKPFVQRRRTLQGGNPFPLQLIRTIDDGPKWIEAWLHGFFSGLRISGEWFRYHSDMLLVEPPRQMPDGFLIPRPGGMVARGGDFIAPPRECAYCDRRREATAVRMRQRREKKKKT